MKKLIDVSTIEEVIEALKDSAEQYRGDEEDAIWNFIADEFEALAERIENFEEEEAE